MAITRAPAARASCTAAEPTPPAAACTSTVSPACSPPRSWSPSHARWNGKKNAAAPVSSSDAGASNTMSTGAITASAWPPNAPCAVATTRRPTQASPPGPAASTTPVTSMPSVYGIGGFTVRYRPRQPSTSL